MTGNWAFVISDTLFVSKQEQYVYGHTDNEVSPGKALIIDPRGNEHITEVIRAVPTRCSCGEHKQVYYAQVRMAQPIQIGSTIKAV